tara:strand:+ start:377 stop:748 length:372 start_codon:yes stop_codon:yes gene_type:complete
MDMNRADWAIKTITSMKENAEIDIKKFAEKLLDDPFYQFTWADAAMEKAAIYKVARIVIKQYEKGISGMFEQELIINEIKNDLLQEIICKSNYPESSSSSSSNTMARYELVAFTRIYNELKRA